MYGQLIILLRADSKKERDRIESYSAIIIIITVIPAVCVSSGPAHEAPAVVCCGIFFFPLPPKYTMATLLPRAHIARTKASIIFRPTPSPGDVCLITGSVKGPAKSPVRFAGARPF